MSLDVLINGVDQEMWRQYAEQFADYSIYQSVPYQQTRSESCRQELCSVMVKDSDSNVVLMCHMRTKHITGLNLKIGYVQLGPLVRKMNGQLSCTAQILQKFCQSLLDSSVNILRIVPNVWDDGHGQEFIGMLETAGFKPVKSVKPYHTFMVSLGESPEEIQARIHRESRRVIRKTQKQDLEIKEGTDENFFCILESLYLQAKRRKGFKGVDSQEFARAQRLLPDNQKPRIQIAFLDGRPISALATSHFGDTAVPIIAANNEQGLKYSALYLLYWKAYLFAKDMGMKYYDLGGIDEQKDPKGYLFKKRLGGIKVSYIGAFEACRGAISKSVWRITERSYNLVSK